MNHETATDSPAEELASRSSLSPFRMVLDVVLLALIVGLFWDMSQRKAIAKAEKAVNDLVEKDIEDTRAYMKAKNRQMPYEERAINQSAIQELLKETYGREAKSGSSPFGSVDTFLWNGFFYRYVLTVEYTVYRMGGSGQADKPKTALIASKASWESKMRFSK